jgi:hypothetical protein
VHLAYGARRTNDLRSLVNLGSQTKLRIQVKDLLFDDAYCSKVIDDKKSWFTRIEVRDFIHHQFCLHRKYLEVTTDHIAVLSTAHTADVSTCGCSYSLSVI